MHKDIIIRKAKASDVTAFMAMCASVFKATYASPAVGIPPTQFRQDLFMSAYNREYFEELFTGVNAHAYVACKHDQIVGGVGLQLVNGSYHVGAFYVAVDYQRQGIGSQLWVKAETIMQGKPAHLEVIGMAYQALTMYLAKGFKIDPSNPYTNFTPIWLPSHTYLMYRLVRG
jgi:ribosomal protein S18 acetylase RimI-like enzyme